MTYHPDNWREPLLPTHLWDNAIDARCAEAADHAALARTPLYDATRTLLADLAELAAVETVDDLRWLWGAA